MAGYGDFAYYYDLLTGNVDYESRCDYIASLLAENGIGKGILLDLACGTGTVSLLMSKKGYDVIGVDASEEMLSQAQEKKMEAGADIIFLCQRMEELDLFGTVNAAVSTLDSLNHVTDEEKLREIFRMRVFSFSMSILPISTERYWGIIPSFTIWRMCTVSGRTAPMRSFSPR